MPWIIQNQEGSHCIHKKLEDGSIGEMVAGGCHATEAEAQAHLRALYANVNEMTVPEDVQTAIDESTNGTLERISEIGMETRMQKGFPDIPLAEGISLDEIKSVDPAPTFVTLQIAEIGKTSRQGIYYDSELVDVIEQTVKKSRPGGIFGHPNPENADFDFPDPAALWVGAARQGNVLWGKAWIRDPQAARRVRDTGLVGGTLGTSIWGRAKKEAKDGATRLKNFMLERIDFAPIERASLPLSGAFALTAEMTTTEDKPVTIEELKAELEKLTPEVVINILSPQAFERVSEMVIRKHEVLSQAGDSELIAELTVANNMKDSLIAEISTERDALKEANKTLESDLFDHNVDATVRWATDWVVTTPKGKQQLNALRSYLKQGLVAEMKANEPLKEAMNRVMEGERYKLVIEMTKKEIGGGALTSQFVDPRTPEVLVPTDEQIADARARTGL